MQRELVIWCENARAIGHNVPPDASNLSTNQLLAVYDRVMAYQAGGGQYAKSPS